MSEDQSQPHDDQQGTDEPPAHPFAPRPHPALTSDTQMVALGSRRPADALLGSANGNRWTNPGGFPPVETNGHHNGEPAPRHGGAPVPGPAVPGARSPFAPPGDDPLRSAFLPSGEEAPQPGFGQPAPGQPGFGPSASGQPAAGQPGSGQPGSSQPGSSQPASGQPFSGRSGDGPGGDIRTGDARSPFAPAEDTGPAGAPFAPSPFAPPAPAAPAASASGSAAVTSPEPQVSATPPPAPPVAPPPLPRPVSAGPSAAGSAQVPVPMGGRPPVSGPPAPAAPPVPVAPDLLAPTRLEPTGWATAGPRPAAAGSATVPVSAPGGGRRSRDDQAADRAADRAADETADQAPAQAAPAGAAPKRPGDVTDHAITFWSDSASEQFRADWHEVKAQFVDDPVAALTRAHDLLTEAVHELTESMLAERDELDPLRGAAQPDTESMRMAMRGYREFLDRILAL